MPVTWLMKSPLKEFLITLPVNAGDEAGAPVIEDADPDEQAAVEIFLSRAYSFRGHLLKFPCLPFQLDSALKETKTLSRYLPEVIDGEELIIYPKPLSPEAEAMGLKY